MGGVTTKYYYMEGGDGLAGLYTTTTGSGGGSHAMAAVTDHLGSILGLFDCWDYVDVYMYDAWGARTCLTGDADFDRGFTGHEHLDEVGLIDMNGRMYDPLIARFLSPDPFVQTPSDPQNFNRYSYCLNNPLKYTDPSGELAWEAVVIGSIFAANLNVAYQCVNGNINTCGDVFKYAAIGAASGASGAIVGQVVAAGISVGGFLGGAAICGSSGFTSGFISGAGNAWARGSNSGDIISAGLIEGGIGGLTAGLTGGIIAGIGTRLGGRRFWDGATVEKNLIYNKNIPKVGGDGKYGCLDACVESIDKSRCGNITKNKVRSWFPNNIDPNKNALVDKEVWSIYANETNMKMFGYSKNFIDKNTFSSFFMEGIKRGDYCSLTMNTGFSIDHSTVVNQVTERIITKMNGEILTKYTVKLMNPALGGHYINYYNIQHLLNSSNNIIRLW